MQRLAQFLIFVLLVPLAQAQQENETEYFNPEVTLVKMLLQKSDPNAMPFHGTDEPLQVIVAFVLGRIAELNEKSQVLTTFGWLYVGWYDHSLHWDPAKHHNITKLVVDPKDIWMPEIAIQNTVDEGNDVTMDTQFRVQLYQGWQNWVPGARLATSCSVDLTYFPFDQQTCEINIITWSFVESVKLVPSGEEVGLFNYQASEEWELIGTEVAIQLVGDYEQEDGEKLPVISHRLHLKRKPTFYMLNIVTPTVIMSLISLMVFALPAASGEKVSLGISILLSYSVLTLLISDTMPRSSEVIPYLAIYLAVCMSLTGISLICTVGVINIHHHSPDRQIPSVIRLIFLKGLGRLLCMPSAYRINQNKVGGSRRMQHRGSQQDMANGVNPQTGRGFKPHESDQVVAWTTKDGPPHVGGTSLTETDDVTSGNSQNEWYVLASVIDRLFLLIFTLAIMLTSGILLGTIADH